MKSLVYLGLTGAKNSLKELIHKPGRLILYLFMIALIVFLIFSPAFSQDRYDETMPPYIFEIAIFAFITMFLIMGIQKSLSSGSTLFAMSDVNFLFVSPLNPRTILFYGLIKLAKTSLFAGVFILFQSATLRMFGIGTGGLITLFVIYIASVIVQSLLSLIIYSLTNGRAQRKRVVRIVVVACFVPALVFLAWHILQNGDIGTALETTVASPVFTAIPIAGWAAAGAMGLMTGDLTSGLLWSGVLLVCGIIMVAYIALSKIDYFEDVLVATETAFERRRAIADGDINATSRTTGTVRVKGTGLRGRGASTFFFKHLREIFRENRFGFFGLSTLIVFATIMLLSLFLREDLDLVVVLQIAMMMQIMMVGTGSGLKELYTHYLYLVPDSSMKKLIWCNVDTAFKTFMEGLLYFVVPGIILAEHPLVIALSVATYTCFTLVLLGINNLSLRWTKTNLAQGLMLTIYFLAIAVVMSPGVIAAFVAFIFIGETTGIIVGLVALCVWEIIATLATFALARNVLTASDMPSLKV